MHYNPVLVKDHIIIYGDKGAIVMTGCYGQGELSIYNAQNEWEQTPVPSYITDQLPNIDDDTQRNWTTLMREFVADIRGESYTKYQTFDDGRVYQQIIERIRVNKFST